MASLNDFQKINQQIECFYQMLNRIMALDSAAILQHINVYQQILSTIESSTLYQSILQNQDSISQLVNSVNAISSLDFVYELQTNEIITLDKYSANVFLSAFNLVKDSGILSDRVKESVKSDTERKQLSKENINFWISIFAVLLDIFFVIFDHLPDTQQQHTTEYYQNQIKIQTHLAEIEDSKLAIEREKLELIKQLLDKFKEISDNEQIIDPSMLEIIYDNNQDIHSDFPVRISDQIQQHINTEK